MTTEPTLPGLEPDVDVDPATAARERWGMLDALLAQGRQFTRKASVTRCPTCRAQVLTGADALMAATSVTVDPTPLDPESELACKLAGRGLYTVRRVDDRLELDYRDEWGTPGHATRPVVPAHLCGHRFPGDLTTLAQAYARGPHERK